MLKMIRIISVLFDFHKPSDHLDYNQIKFFGFLIKIIVYMILNRFLNGMAYH